MKMTTTGSFMDDVRLARKLMSSGSPVSLTRTPAGAIVTFEGKSYSLRQRTVERVIKERHRKNLPTTHEL